MAARNPPAILAKGQAPNNRTVIPVIDDAKRVTQIKTRGDDDYRRHNHQMHTDRKQISTSIQQKDVILQVATQLEDASESTPFAPDPQNSFISRGRFDEIMTPWVVLQIIRQLECYKKLKPDQQNSVAKDVYYGSSNGRRPPSRKLLVALIVTPDSYGPRPVESFDILVEEGMSDVCLPLSRHEGTGELYCESHSCVHESINKLGSVRKQFRKYFAGWSRALTAPFIVWDEKGLHRHYIMEGGGPLPTMGTSSLEHSGGFGKVWKVDIDPKDRRFKSKSHPQGQERHFALKKLNQNNSTSTLTMEFDMEVRSLIFAESRVNRIPEAGDTETKQHLIQLLATFEVYNTRKGPPDYYLLFPWADGDLEDLWRDEDGQRNPTDEMQLDFMIDQFYYLTKALQCVHNDRQEIARNTGTDGRLFGRHGDITPKNFLIFRNVLDQQLHWQGLRIVLADFGLGRLHSEVSRSKDDGSNIPHTITYAAPEYDVDGRWLSPKSDIFSLGCVFLLYIVWLFDGANTALTTFSQERMSERDCRDTMDGEPWELDRFWVKTVTEGRRGAAIKESVKRRLDNLRNRVNCVEVVGDILTVIERRMLRINQNDRFGAERLVFELDRIRKQWKRADSLYGKRAWKDVER
ncbi:kinase-like domain-containing protein [Rhypophila decipiens]|uniref:Kinase-like domain-containing protein n=1 Tax=Rhypophila decipiens TaxID=261697 RepID=A0AAN7B1J6_9PEZI|nr:kinase-like domain-containing protein [Rhypophila decipiens]